MQAFSLHHGEMFAEDSRVVADNDELGGGEQRRSASRIVDPNGDTFRNTARMREIYMSEGAKLGLPGNFVPQRLSNSGTAEYECRNEIQGGSPDRDYRNHDNDRDPCARPSHSAGLDEFSGNEVVG